MYRVLFGLLFLPALSGAEAAETLKLLDLTGVSNGTYVLVITDAGFELQPARIFRVGPVPPPPPPPPGPVVLTERAKLIKVASEGATADPKRAETAKAISTAVAKTKGLIDDGKLVTYTQISQSAALGWDSATLGQVPAWAQCRKLVMDELAKLAQEGATAASYGSYLGEVVAGLNAS